MIGIDDIVSACGLVTCVDEAGRPSYGTGYLVAPHLFATCEHVVRDAEQRKVNIFFGDDILRSAKTVCSNEDLDCAVVELDTPIADVRPLVLGGLCEWKAPWDSYGFPGTAKGAGITLEGVVSNPKSRDDKKAAVLELTSPDVAAGMATPLHGFSGSPVIVAGVVVGHLKRFVADPNEPARPAYGKVYATPSACIASLLSGVVVVKNEPLSPPPLTSPQHAAQLNRVRDILQAWKAADMPMEHANLLAAESMIQLGAPLEALMVLGETPSTLRQNQLLALALAKTEDHSNLLQAVNILRDLQRAGHFDAETGGLLGGRLKQLWRESGNKTALERSHEMYSTAFEKTSDPYPGINAAATALWLGDQTRSEELAKAALEKLEVKPAASTFWDLATKAEGLLLTGEVERAKQYYKAASLGCEYAPESIRTMSLQAKQSARVLGLDEEIFGDAFKT